MSNYIVPISDEDYEESEVEILANDSILKTSNKDRNDAEESDEENNDDNEDDEEGFEVEAILNHKVEKGGKKLFFLIKWQGYDEEEDQTWEPEENLETAQEILTEYLESQGGRASILSAATSTKKRKARDSSTIAASSGRKKNRNAEPESDISTPSGSAERQLPHGSWEDLIAVIDHIAEYRDPRDGEVKRYGFIRWNDGKEPYHTRHPLETLYAKCPQKMLRYYESHLVFRTNLPDETQGEEDEE